MQTALCDLYGQFGEPERLQRFLSAVAAATGSHLGLMIRQDLRAGGRMLAANGIDSLEMARYEGKHSEQNIWFERASGHTRAGFVFVSDEWVRLRELRATQWYNDYLRPIDVAHSTGICGSLDAGKGMFLSLCRSARTGAYDGSDRRFLELLSPHFVNACQIQSQLERVRSTEQEQRADRRALFLLDRRLCWVNDNPAAAAIVAVGWWRGGLGRPIEPVHPMTRAAWNASLRELTTGTPSSTFSVYGRDQSLVAFARLSRYAAAEGSLTYALFVRPLNLAESADTAAQLRHLFDLTPSEANLALALRRHPDLEQAAAALGIALSGARTRLQSILDKTGMHRRSGLVRLLDALNDTLC
ncbi:helix-turn-helix transcriptional regulator [Pseudomonas sp. CGJS7]|uniref:helix-turn-helix transcriptional regulator n=1 Tax=Pseudomonas sp. CGJS7 TaxID=3109348 RepID=UPI00300A2D1E